MLFNNSFRAGQRALQSLTVTGLLAIPVLPSVSHALDPLQAIVSYALLVHIYLMAHAFKRTVVAFVKVPLSLPTMSRTNVTVSSSLLCSCILLTWSHSLWSQVHFLPNPKLQCCIYHQPGPVYWLPPWSRPLPGCLCGKLPFRCLLVTHG